MWIYGIRFGTLLTKNYWCLTFWARHGGKFFRSLDLLRYILLMLIVVCPSPEKITTWFLRRISLPLIIHLSMLIIPIMMLVWYSALQIGQIHRRMRYHIIIFFIIWEMISWRIWNEKMYRAMMTLIIVLGIDIKCMIKRTLCMIPLKKKRINKIYTWISEPTNGAKYLFKGKNIVYLS